MAVILCVDDAESIYAQYNRNNGRQCYELDFIRKVIKVEKQTAAKFCEDYNIPIVTCMSNDIHSMNDFISVYSSPG